MFDKKIIFGLMLLFVLLALNPINAVDDEGYITDVSGIEFKIPADFDSSEVIFDEDHKVLGHPAHIYGIEFTSNEKAGMIYIAVNTRYDEPYDVQDGLDAVGDEKVIAGKKGSYNAQENRFIYVDHGALITVEAPSVDMIEYCINA